MTCKHTMRWRSRCQCCDDRVAHDPRHLLFGGAMLGVASAAGFFASTTGAAAQGAPNLGTAPPRGGDFILRGGYVITMDRGLGDIPIGDVHVRNGEIAEAAVHGEDRKSTRLNSSHQIISYAVFCLKKKKHTY